MKDEPQTWAGRSPAMTGRHWRALLAAACGVVAMLLAADAASASTVQFDSSITCSAEAPCGPASSMMPGAIAVNEQTGDVYVIDAEHNAIDVFDAEGEYLSQIAGSSSEPPFSLGGYGPEYDDITIDNSGGPNEGHIYAASTAEGLTYAFDSTGKLLWKSSAGATSFLLGVAVDMSGNPWVSDYSNGVLELNPTDGSAVGTSYLKEKTDHIDFETSGDIAVQAPGGGGHVYALPSEKELVSDDTGLGGSDIATFTGASPVYNDAVFTLDSNGVTIWDSSGKQLPETPFGARGSAVAVAVNSANNKIYVSVPGEGKVEIYTLIPRYLLGVSTTGNGLGVVTCGGGTCAPNYPDDEPVRLETITAEGSTFAGWSVNGSSTTCPGTEACELTLSANTTVQARFTLEEHELTVAETGAGEVQSNPPGIACGSACKAMVAGDELVVLSAMPAPHNHLAAWSGCDSVTAGKCEVAVSSDKTVSAQFTPTMDRLAVGIAGGGSGTVACQVEGGRPEPCAAEYLDGTVLTLTGTPTSGSTFAGFSGGGCSAAGPCTVTLSGDTALTATFAMTPVQSPMAPPSVAKPVVPAPQAVPPPPAEKPAVKKKSPTRSQLLRAAIRKCKRLPKRKRAACLKRARRKYGRTKRGKRR